MRGGGRAAPGLRPGLLEVCRRGCLLVGRRSVARVASGLSLGRCLAFAGLPLSGCWSFVGAAARYCWSDSGLPLVYRSSVAALSQAPFLFRARSVAGLPLVCIFGSAWDAGLSVVCCRSAACLLTLRRWPNFLCGGWLPGPLRGLSLVFCLEAAPLAPLRRRDGSLRSRIECRSAAHLLSGGFWLVAAFFLCLVCRWAAPQAVAGFLKVSWWAETGGCSSRAARRWANCLLKPFHC